MNKKIRTKAKFENGLLKPSKPIDLYIGEEVEIIVIREENGLDDAEDVTSLDLMNAASENLSFDFLKDVEEDIYSVDDLKKRY